MKYKLIGIANRAACAGGLLQFLAGLYFFDKLGLQHMSLQGLAYLALLIGLYVASIYAGLATALKLWRHEAEEVDRVALARVDSGGHYFLYLRSFLFEGDIRLREDNFEAWMRTCWTRSLRSSPRFYVAMAIKSVGPTLGIGGDPGLGMTRYTSSDANWTADFERLANGAAGIFVLPSVTEGSAWELEWLCVNALHKTVFMFPPQSAVSREMADAFWEHYVEFINRYTGFGFAEEGVFDRRAGHIFMLKERQFPPSDDDSRVARAWRFSSIGLEAAAEFLVQQAAAAFNTRAAQSSD